ncbi:MAG: phospho-N-acetylmuramoyl-pentapeptide-transferase [bacterium]|nr:phospho-N-acetylmuramoyl-pentapeptide-transferase [bacterium]
MLYHLLTSLAGSLSALNVFRFITFRTAISTLTALVMSLVLGPVLIRILQKRQIGEIIRVDGPKSHHSKRDTPTMGGLLILFAVLVPVLLWNDLTNGFVWLSVFIIVGFGALGFLDDYIKVILKKKSGVTVGKKFLLQFVIGLAAGYALYSGMVSSAFEPVVMFPFFKNLHPNIGVWFIPYAAIVIVATSNAVNLTDGLDGLAIGPLMIAVGAYLVFSYVAGHAVISKYLLVLHVTGAGELAILCGAIFGAGLGFLWFNAYPAQVFMGDVGALPLGAVLGTIALSIKQELLLFLVGGLFVIEALSVILQVGSFKMRKKRIFHMAPLHHHFEELGWQEPKVTVRFWIIAIVLALLSLSTLKLR